MHKGLTLLTVFGTRPEAIKMAPVISQSRTYPYIKTVVCVTAQHRQMLDHVLDMFRISPDYDLNIMRRGQDLSDVTVECLVQLGRIYKEVRPGAVLVQGDTTTAFAAGLAAYYAKTPVAHIEAGLRTYDKYSPFPEELNRHMLGTISDYHFAPTAWARDNLVKEGVDKRRIWVTGNTAIDALRMIRAMQKDPHEKRRYEAFLRDEICLDGADARKKMILVTGHRRENFGDGFRNICAALKTIALEMDDALIVYPVHLNPNVQTVVRRVLGRIRNIRLIDPVDYGTFVFLMSRAHLILTDSGGIQEEAPALGKPVLLMRRTTERPEAIRAGAVRMVGTDADTIVKSVRELMNDRRRYGAMSRAVNPFGDGYAAGRIIRNLIKIWERERLKS